MIKDVMLAWYSSYGGSLSGGGQIADTLNQWEQAGVFSYMIPFLLIFAVVYGILNKMNLFGDSKNKQINGIISLGVALMAIQFDVVLIFFQDIFPRVGIAIAGILVFIILMGLFGQKDNKTLSNTLMWSSFTVAIIIILQSTKMFRERSSDWLGIIPTEWLPTIIFIIIVVIVLSSAKDSDKGSTNSSFMKGFNN